MDTRTVKYIRKVENSLRKEKRKSQYLDYPRLNLDSGAPKALFSFPRSQKNVLMAKKKHLHYREDSMPKQNFPEPLIVCTETHDVTCYHVTIVDAERLCM